MAAVTGVVISAATAGASFYQANKAKQEMRKAESKAAQFMADARKANEVNEMDRVNVNKDAYDRQSEDALRANAQALMAITEADPRGLGNVGRVLAQTNRSQAEIRESLNRDLFNMQAASAEEAARRRDIGIQLDLEESSGASAAAAEAGDRMNASLNQGIQSSIGAVGQAIKLPKLYKQDLGAQRSALAGTQMSQDQFQKIGNIKGGSMGELAGEGFTNLDLDAVGQMSNRQFRRFKRDLNPEQERMLFFNKDYTNNYMQSFNPY